MYRLFDTHKVRRCEELSSCLWDLHVLDDKKPCEKKCFVPGCLENLPGYGKYRGEAVYSRRFTAAGNIRLEFKGISHTAWIYVDGVKVKEHYGAYTPFDVIVPDLAPGEHTLEVKVSNRFSEASALHIPNDYMSYCGITRPVVLEHVGSAYVEWAHYTTRKEGDTWQLGVEISVSCLKDTAPVEAVVRIDHREFILPGKALAQGERVLLSGTFAMGEVLEWTTETPDLYTVEAVLKTDREILDDLVERIGFREVRIAGNRILLNGRALRIKGICRHEDYTGFGCALPAAAIHGDLQQIRDMGCNSIRTVHYPNDEIFLDMCDEMGILVWEEHHARGLQEEDMRNPNFDWQCELCNEEMVRCHFNHPSIYIWGVLNECASHTEYGRICYQKQLEQLRKLDTTRPLTFASCKFKKEPDGSNLYLTDLCLDLPDVVSYNIYPRWYFEPDIPKFLSDLHACIEQSSGAGKPLLISEMGAGGEYGFRTPERLKWSEEYQMDALEEQLTALLAAQAYSGVYIWQFCDCRVSEEWFPERPRSYNNKGLVDTYRRPKLAYETVKRIFGDYPDYF